MNYHQKKKTMNSRESERSEPNEINDLIEKQANIFVSIASYRDPETPKTVQHLFKTAANPGRITVLINEQNQPSSKTTKQLQENDYEDVSVMNFPNSSRYAQQIRILQINSYEARGPVIARAQIEEELYTPGEADFWLQIDSHMAFVKHWDNVLIRQNKMLPEPDKSILTTLPPDYNPGDRKSLPSLSLPNFIGFHDYNNIRHFPTQQRYQFQNFPDVPRRSLFYAGCFAFSPASIIERVPYDKYAPYLFLGEEISMAARFFTNGYDLFSPSSSPVFHLTSRKYRPLFWEQLHVKNAKTSPVVREERKLIEANSVARIQNLIFYGKNPTEGGGIYGLGNERSLDDFQKFTGLNFLNKNASPRAKLGIEENASDAEWIEKYNVRKSKWEYALRNLKPIIPVDFKITSSYGSNKPSHKPAPVVRQLY